nr:unnamed protein product [Callosobruchus chinensis]
MQPGKVIAVDESMLPFHGRLKFRQYIPGKRHKYDMRSKGIYTYSFSVYKDKSAASDGSVPTSTVLNLCQDYLDEERVVLKKGSIIGRENVDGIVLSKWKDKIDVLMLSTCHTLDIIKTRKLNRKREEIQKPQCIIDYNAGKARIDLSDQLAAYSSPIRKSVRWYHKVAIELLMCTSVVNALFLQTGESNIKNFYVLQNFMKL